MRQRQAIAVLALAGCFVALYLWLYKLGVMGDLRCGTGFPVAKRCVNRNALP